MKIMIKKKIKEKKKKKSLNNLKNVILKNVVIKKNLNISYLMCLTIFV